MTAPPPYGRSPRVPGPREVAQTYFLVGNNNQHPHLQYTLLLPTRTGNVENYILYSFFNVFQGWYLEVVEIMHSKILELMSKIVKNKVFFFLNNAQKSSHFATKHSKTQQMA